MPEGLFQIVFLFTTTISSIELRRNIRKGLVVDKYRIGICIAAVTFLLFFTTPIVHDFRIGHFAYFLIFIQIIFFNDIIFYNSYKFLKKLFIIISVFAIVFWVLNAMGVPLIYYKWRGNWTNMWCFCRTRAFWYLHRINACYWKIQFLREKEFVTSDNRIPYIFNSLLWYILFGCLV